MTRRKRRQGRSSVALIATALAATLLVVAVLLLYGLLGAGGGVLPDLASEILLVSVTAAVVSTVFAVPVTLLTMRNRDDVEEVFLVHESGLLLAHLSRTLKAEKDRDVLAGMLTAVQDFVREALAKGPSRDLRQMDFGKRKILLCRGSVCYLAVIMRGRRPAVFTHRVKRSLVKVEHAYWAVLSAWDGRTQGLEGADDLLRRELMDVSLRTMTRDMIDTAVDGVTTWLVSLAQRRRTRDEGQPHGNGESLKERAAALLRRPESREMPPSYRAYLVTALEQIEDGIFTFAGATNVYMAIALQKRPGPGVSAWWDEVLLTIRDVLESWPWDPTSQAWVEPRAPPAAAEPSEAQPAEVAVDSPAPQTDPKL